MKHSAIFVAVSLALLSGPARSQPPHSAPAPPAVRRVILFDQGWKFHRGGAQFAEQPDFDDRSWRTLDLPHDWTIEDLPGTTSPFNRDAIGQVSTGFTTGGTGWYRKAFALTDSDKSKRILIQFDGIYMNPEIWLNGQSLGEHPYGYTSFWYDITDKAKFGAPNVLAVKVRNEGENSRWYSGSGIYRHVWLKVVDPVHVAQWGTSITTRDVSAASASVRVAVRVQNETAAQVDATVTTRILDPSGTEVGRLSTTLPGVLPQGAADTSRELVLRNPALWSVDTPALYTAVTEISTREGVVDRDDARFGIRSTSFTVDGFRLNGVPMKLHGGCFHDDHGPLGSKSYDRAEERRIQLLKASGFNAVRCSHNPPAQAFLDAADRLGMLVVDEAFDMWADGKNPHDYHLWFDKWWQRDLESMIARDRNHPSVIAWSIGNEIPGMDEPRVVETAKTLAAFVRKTDPTRPVLAAVNNLNPKKDPFMSALDIAGYNYGSGGDHQQQSIFSADHQRVPSRIMIQTESYPLEAFKSWMDVLDHPWLLGDFVWTAFDYLGEASIGWRGYWQEQNFFPWNVAYCGDIDICGWKRPQSYYRDALWKENQLSLFVKPPPPSFPENPKRQAWSKWHWLDAVADWNWGGHESHPIQVTAYSSCDEVELFLNGQSLGRKKTDRSTQFMASWDVPYRPGELKALGYRAGQQVASASLKTARTVSRIVATADRDRLTADGEDLSYVTVELKDASGTRDPKADNLLTFTIDGPGTIAAVGNANPVSLESFQRPERRAWRGRCLVIVKSGRQPGDVHLKISAEGLQPATITIHSVVS